MPEKIKNIDLTGCVNREEKMFRAMDVAIQWIDDGEIETARQILADVYSPIYAEELDKHDDGKASFIS